MDVVTYKQGMDARFMGSMSINGRIDGKVEEFC